MSLPIYGLVSSYREGRLSLTAVESLLACCDEVFVLEGPVGDIETWGRLHREDGSEAGEESIFPKHSKRVHVRTGKAGEWASDAAKRTALVRWLQEWRLDGGKEAWAVVLDGDEVMMWPEFLPDYLARAERDERGRGGMKLKLSFEDGQVYETGARCLPIHLVDEYVLSSYQLRLKGLQTVWTAPLIPASKAPLQGEPHILHRGYLRPPERNAPALRLSSRELEDLASLGIGAPSPDGPLRITPGRTIIIPGE